MIKHLIIEGMEYRAEVFHYQRACPMRTTGTGFGDAEPPVDEEIEFDLYIGRSLITDAAVIATAEKLLLQSYRK